MDVVNMKYLLLILMLPDNSQHSATQQQVESNVLLLEVYSHSQDMKSHQRRSSHQVKEMSVM